MLYHQLSYQMYNLHYYFLHNLIHHLWNNDMLQYFLFPHSLLHLMLYYPLLLMMLHYLLFCHLLGETRKQPPPEGWQRFRTGFPLRLEMAGSPCRITTLQNGCCRGRRRGSGARRGGGSPVFLRLVRGGLAV